MIMVGCPLYHLGVENHLQHLFKGNYNNSSGSRKLSIPFLSRVIGNSKGRGGLKDQLKKSMKLNCNFQRGGEGRGSNKKTLCGVGRVWIFSGITQYSNSIAIAIAI